MPFKLIKGRYFVTGYSPDGDSIRFEADNTAFLNDLSGFRPKINQRNHVQLRIEAIDTLETHYQVKGGGTYHQPLELARAAAEALLGFVGITDVRWDATGRTVLSAREAVRGYLLARSVEKNGRPVAFVYAGDAAEADGSDVHLDAQRLNASYNSFALEQGLAYPTFYRGLFQDLRAALTDAASRAREAGAGLYAVDGTETGFDAGRLATITEETPILPKLFRRLSEYMVNYGSAVGFKEKMEQSQEPVFDLRTANFTHFDTFIEQAEGETRIRLSRRPEELVFDEMKARPAEAFSALMGVSARIGPEAALLSGSRVLAPAVDYSVW